MNSKKLIDTLGGTFVVARMFEVRPPSVSGWKRRGIPKARLQTLKLMRPDLFNEKSLTEYIGPPPPKKDEVA